MGQIVIPTKGEVYIVKCRAGDSVWIFESDFNEGKGIYTEATYAYCFNGNGNSLMQDRIVNHHCVVLRDNRGIKWMRLASEDEKRLFYLKINRGYL